MEKIVSAISSAMYTYILIILLVGAGIYFTVRTRFAPFRMLKEQICAVTEKPADVTMGLMTLINIPVILILGKYAFRAIKDYEKQKKEGKEPVFYAKNIGLPHNVDCWREKNENRSFYRLPLL